jgi:predicted ABC-type ATPase
MTEQETEIETQAIIFAKANRTRIARELTDLGKYPADQLPVSIFMCGSPGAGKTEASKAFIEVFDETGIIRLDPDELRVYFQEYTGKNSYLFQKAVSFIVERTLDRIFNNDQSFILDGTLSNFDIACKNIDRSLMRNRAVLIIFVYQEPVLAWEFVQAREKLEGRGILPSIFIDQFLNSQKVVRQVKTKYGASIKIDLLIKNNDGSTRIYHDDITAVEHHIEKEYTRAELVRLLNLPPEPIS